jgi:hypothetical protein
MQLDLQLAAGKKARWPNAPRICVSLSAASRLVRRVGLLLLRLSKRDTIERLCTERGPMRTARPKRSRTMEYLLLIHSDEKALQSATQEETGSILAAYGAYMKAMADAGVSKGGQRLRPTSTATTVRVQNGKTQVLNGPYAEVKEQLGGYFLIDAPDLDAAISWAARCPGAQYGAIEVRPIWQM